MQFEKHLDAIDNFRYVMDGKNRDIDTAVRLYETFMNGLIDGAKANVVLMDVANKLSIFSGGWAVAKGGATLLFWLAGRGGGGAAFAVAGNGVFAGAQRLTIAVSIDGVILQGGVAAVISRVTLPRDDEFFSGNQREAGQGQNNPEPFPWRDQDVGAPVDQRLTQRARALRQREGLLTEEGMERNVAVAKVRVNGQEQFIERSNIRGGQHSEELIAADIARLRADGNTVEALELFSDRIPCPRAGGCRPMIQQHMPGVRVFAFTRNSGSRAASDLWEIYRVQLPLPALPKHR